MGAGYFSVRVTSEVHLHVHQRNIFLQIRVTIHPLSIHYKRLELFPALRPPFISSNMNWLAEDENAPTHLRRFPQRETIQFQAVWKVGFNCNINFSLFHPLTLTGDQ